MNDRRLTPANGRVAALHLAGQVAADRFVAGAARMMCRPVSDLCATPGGARDRQMLLGAPVQMFEDRDGWAFVQGACGYVGYVDSGRLGPVVDTTHVVSAVATHAYAVADFKAAPVLALPFGARVRVGDVGARFCATNVGFIPSVHLRAQSVPCPDPVAIARMHIGVPYLWGGNSTRGIDCSGLVAAALGACGIACPGDSDLQLAALGADFAGPPRRGDLIFWHGHVAMMCDDSQIIHANAYHMATATESLESATARIAGQGGGPVIARRRLTAT